MVGISIDDGTLIVDRPPNDLDELAIQFTDICDDLDIAHVYVSGYVAILTGRSRATEDIDVLLDRVEPDVIDRLVDELAKAGLWGPAMPLERMNEMLEDNIWVARADEMIPHLEVKFVDDRIDRASLKNRIVARIEGAELPIGPIELQIAYKLWMSGNTDFEDAVHLYSLFEETLRTHELQRWVEELGVEEEYERLQRVC